MKIQVCESLFSILGLRGQSRWALLNTVADVSVEDRVGNILLQIEELRFGHKAQLLFRLWAQGLVKMLKLKLRRDLKLIFDQYFADVWLRLWSWILVKILKLGFVKILNSKFIGDADCWYLAKNLMLSRDSKDEFDQICVWTCDITSRSYFDKMNSTLGSVVPLAMF